MKLAVMAGGLGAVLILVAVVAGGAEKPRGTLIYYGWGLPDTHALRTQRSQLGALPFDGSGVAIAIDRQAWLRGDSSTKNALGWQLMGTRRFMLSQFADAVEDLKVVGREARWKVFLPLTLSGESAKGFDWFDDDRWRSAISNVEVLATIAGSTGATGFILDPEDYSGVRLLREPLPEDAERRAALRTKARQRGGEVMSAIARHVPGAVVLALYGHSLVLKHKSPGPREFELVGPFFDGVIEKMSGESVFVDGFEYSYGFKTRGEFTAGAREIYGLGQKVTAVREVFDRRVRAGFGLWVDYRKQLNYWSPADFANVVGDALEVSGGYVWIYSHAVRFFPPNELGEAYGAAIQRMRSERGR